MGASQPGITLPQTYRTATSLQLAFPASEEQGLVSAWIKLQLKLLLTCVALNFLNLSLDQS